MIVCTSDGNPLRVVIEVSPPLLSSAKRNSRSDPDIAPEFICALIYEVTFEFKTV